MMKKLFYLFFATFVLFNITLVGCQQDTAEEISTSSSLKGSVWIQKNKKAGETSKLSFSEKTFKYLHTVDEEGTTTIAGRYSYNSPHVFLYFLDTETGKENRDTATVQDGVMILKEETFLLVK